MCSVWRWKTLICVTGYAWGHQIKLMETSSINNEFSFIYSLDNRQKPQQLLRQDGDMLIILEHICDPIDWKHDVTPT